MNANLSKKNPFRPKSASSKIFDVLARAAKPLSLTEVRQRSKLPESTVKILLSAYRNPIHLWPLKRIGLALKKIEKGFFLASVTANLNAKRPKPKQKAAKKRAAGKKPKEPETVKTAPVAIPAKPPPETSNP